MDLNKEQKDIILWLVNNELNKTKDGHFNTEVLCEIREAINYSRCCKSDSELLPTKEKQKCGCKTAHSRYWCTYDCDKK